MKSNIIKFINHLFSKYNKDPNVNELKEEYLSNTLEEYNFLIKKGLTEEAAYNQIKKNSQNVDYLFIKYISINELIMPFFYILMYLCICNIVVCLLRIYSLYKQFGISSNINNLNILSIIYIAIVLIIMFYTNLLMKENKKIPIVFTKIYKPLVTITILISVIIAGISLFPILKIIFLEYNLSLSNGFINYTSIFYVILNNLILFFINLSIPLFINLLLRQLKNIDYNEGCKERHINKKILYIIMFFIIIIMNIFIQSFQFIEKEKHTLQHSIETNNPKEYEKYGNDIYSAGSVYALLPGFVSEYSSFLENFEKKEVILNFSINHTTYDCAIYDTVVLFSLYPDIKKITIRYETNTFEITRDSLTEWYGENIFKILDQKKELDSFKNILFNSSEKKLFETLKQLSK